MKRLIATTLMALGVAACAPEKPDIVARNPSGDKAQVAVVVENESFTVEDVNQRLESLPDWARVRFASTERKKSFLATTVQFELLHDEAQRLGYDKDPATIHHLEKRLVEAWIDEKVAEEPVTPEDLREYFEANIEDFRRGEARKTYILQTRTRERAEELRQRILAADGDLIDEFQDQAAKFSFDFVSAGNQGSVGAVTRDGQVVSLPDSEFVRGVDEEVGDFTDIPWQLEEREISKPQEIAGRWLLVVWSEELPPEQVKLEDVSSDVREQLVAQRRRAFVAKYEQ